MNTLHLKKEKVDPLVSPRLRHVLIHDHSQMEAASTWDHLRPVASATWHACRGHVLQRCKWTGTFICPELKAEGSRSDMNSCYLP